MASRESRQIRPFDRSTVEGRRAEMAYLDSLTEAERKKHDPGHRYVTANPVTTAEREKRLADQLADLNTPATDA